MRFVLLSVGWFFLTHVLFFFFSFFLSHLIPGSSSSWPEIVNSGLSIQASSVSHVSWYARPPCSASIISAIELQVFEDALRPILQRQSLAMTTNLERPQTNPDDLLRLPCSSYRASIQAFAVIHLQQSRLAHSKLGINLRSELVTHWISPIELNGFTSKERTSMYRHQHEPKPMASHHFSDTLRTN